MYVWYLPEYLLMIAEDDVVNKLVKTRRLIQEQDIETIPSKSNKIKNWRGQAIFGRWRACSPAGN
jgi:hypothetical protein